MDQFKKIWDDQASLQIDLGLDPRNMDAVQLSGEIKNSLLGLHEETAALGRATTSYKSHLLDAQPDKMNVTIKIADCMKYLLLLAQQHGISRQSLVDAILKKSRVVSSRADAARIKLELDTKLICVDLDDCVADLSVEFDVGITVDGTRMTHDAIEQVKHGLHSSDKFRKLPLIPDAGHSLQTIKTRGYKIAIITARPAWQYRHLHYDTIQWLKSNDVPFDALLFDKDKVDAVYRHLRPAWPKYFIEDHPRNALALASAGIDVILYDRPHNRIVPDHAKITRVKSWNEILEIVK